MPFLDAARRKPVPVLGSSHHRSIGHLLHHGAGDRIPAVPKGRGLIVQDAGVIDLAEFDLASSATRQQQNAKAVAHTT